MGGDYRDNCSFVILPNVVTYGVGPCVWLTVAGVPAVGVRVVVPATPKELYLDEFRRNVWRTRLVVRSG